MTIAKNYSYLLKQVEKASLKAGKNPSDITIVVAAKYASVKQLKELLDAGTTHLGENRAQDLVYHQDNIQPPTSNLQLHWHFIGHLQTNKINKVIGRINMLQSLDSLHLAKALHKRLKLIQKDNKSTKKLPVLIEVNLARDPAKYGINPDNLFTFIEKFSAYQTLKIQGLMTAGKIWESEKEARVHFAKMRQLFESLKSIIPRNTTHNSQPTTHNLQPLHLSMGTSNDYQWAIEEGATIIRVGRALLR